MRLAGQDTRRGTFSQRHGVLVDQDTEHEYVPARAPRRRPGAVPALRHRAVGVRRARLRVRLLGRVRRAGVLGGAVRRLRQRRADRDRPVRRRRRRQVGPAQQPVAAAPARVRGPGPRALERAHRALPHAVRRGQPARRVPHRRRRSTSTCCAARPSPAQRVPLVCFTPKRYLRMPQTHSRVAAFTDGAFHARARRPATRSTRRGARGSSCAPARSAHELIDARDARGAPVAIVRVEQLYPWPEAELFAVLDRYPDAKQVWWVQEEPSNMGAWTYVHERLHQVAARPGQAAARRPRAEREPRDRERRRSTTASSSDLLAAAFA